MRRLEIKSEQEIPNRIRWVTNGFREGEGVGVEVTCEYNETHTETTL